MPEQPFAELARVLRKRASRLLDRDDTAAEERDNAELIAVLARVLEGKPVPKAFGAPGDWGYGTDIGDALAAAYKAMLSASPLPPELERHVADWLRVNEKTPEQVIHGTFPLGMVQRWVERAEKAEAFKRWVHQYLDAHGVPHHPPGTHGDAGCRIGDRMDWWMAKLAAAEAEAKVYLAAPELLAALKTMLNWSHCIRSPDPYEELERDIAAARAAIAKATNGEVARGDPRQQRGSGTPP